MTAASAYSPQSPEPGDGRASEPSMEDILASIRRIIADDQNQGGKQAYGNGARRAAAAPSGGDGERSVARARTPYDDVLDLARLVPSADREIARASSEPHHTLVERVAEPEAHADDEEHADLTQSFDEQSEVAVSGLRARMPEPAARDDEHDDDHGMVARAVPALSDESEGDLLSAPLGASVMSAFETLAATVVLQNTPMLERVMRDLLRPMLKTWLDDNLPALVERLVRTEIERVARGRG